jgi:hypothetical protein
MKCQATNKAGKPCGAPVIRGTKRCVMHSGRAAELGSKGGRRRAVYNPEQLKEFSAPQSAADLRDLLAQSILEIRTGKMDPKLANSISYLGTGFLRALEVSDLETRCEPVCDGTCLPCGMFLHCASNADYLCVNAKESLAENAASPLAVG